MSYTPPNVRLASKLNFNLSMIAAETKFSPVFQYTGRIKIHETVLYNNTITTDATQVVYSGASGAFTTGETVTATPGGATGTVISDDGSSVYLLNVSGTISVGDTLTGGTSGTTATADIINSNYPIGSFLQFGMSVNDDLVTQDAIVLLQSAAIPINGSLPGHEIKCTYKNAFLANPQFANNVCAVENSATSAAAFGSNDLAPKTGGNSYLGIHASNNGSTAAYAGNYDIYAFWEPISPNGNLVAL